MNDNWIIARNFMLTIHNNLSLSFEERGRGVVNRIIATHTELAHYYSLRDKYAPSMIETAEIKYGYMCKVDFDYELGHALGGACIYPDIEDLIENRNCRKQCGIVKVRVTLEEISQEENYKWKTGMKTFTKPI